VLHNIFDHRRVYGEIGTSALVRDFSNFLFTHAITAVVIDEKKRNKIVVAIATILLTIRVEFYSVILVVSFLRCKGSG